MTGELIPGRAIAALFESKEIRIIEDGGDLWLVLEDLAAAWGIDRKTPANLIGRNQEIFEGMFRSDGDVTYHGVNERGLYLLLGKISADRLKNPDAKAAIIRFQRWVPDLLQKFRKGELQQLPGKPALDTELLQAKKIAELTGTELKVMQAAALRKCGLKEYADALVPAVTHGEAGQWLNATQIGNRCGHSAREVNHFLEWHRFQYQGPDRVWRLTELGEAHGEEYWFEATSGHREVRIRWNPSILSASGLIRSPSEQLPGGTS